MAILIGLGGSVGGINPLEKKKIAEDVVRENDPPVDLAQQQDAPNVVDEMSENDRAVSGSAKAGRHDKPLAQEVKSSDATQQHRQQRQTIEEITRENAMLREQVDSGNARIAQLEKDEIRKVFSYGLKMLGRK